MEQSIDDRIRLVAVDMDGTFLDVDGEYDRERFARLHRELARRGVTFVVASGNQYWALRGYFPEYPDALYIAENGALIATSDRVVRTVPFAPQDAAAAVALVQGLPDVFTLVCTESSAYALGSSDPFVLAALHRYYARIELVDRWQDIDDPVLKLALGCPGDATAALQARLAAELPRGCVATSSGHGSIDIIGAGVDKGAALAWLGDRLGLAADAMVAFGDGGNDVEMLRYAGIGVAMANAPAHVRDAADQTTDSNDEAGVLNWLERRLQQAPTAVGARPCAASSLNLEVGP